MSNTVVHAVTTGDYRRWHLFWLIWFVTSVSVFLTAEIYALCTDWQRTLSAAVWSFEKFRTGQGIAQWTFGHLMFIGVLVLLDVWLLGHFGWGLWRG